MLGKMKKINKGKTLIRNKWKDSTLDKRIQSGRVRSKHMKISSSLLLICLLKIMVKQNGGG